MKKGLRRQPETGGCPQNPCLSSVPNLDLMKKGLRPEQVPPRQWPPQKDSVPNLDLMKKGLRPVVYRLPVQVKLKVSSKPRPDEEGIETLYRRQIYT